MTFIGGMLPFLVLVAPQAQQQAVPPTALAQAHATQDATPVARRVAATTRLAAQEYRLGIANGRVVAPAEVEEAALFLQEARRSAVLLPSDAAAEATGEVDALLRLVRATAPPDSLDRHVLGLAAKLTSRLGVTLEELPPHTPSLARGAAIYRTECAGCHGASGGGEGTQGAGLEPPPTNLADANALRGVSPLDYFRRISIGTVGTAMPAFETRLPAADRWAVALYTSTLRLPAAHGEVPPALRSFPSTAVMSDSQVLAALGAGDSAGPAALGRLAAVRAFQGDSADATTAQVFDRVRSQLDSAYALARKGDSSASARAFDAYMTFEQVERDVRAKNPALASDVEAAFASLRTRAAGGATPDELADIRRRLEAGLENSERVLVDQMSPANLFVQSFVILVREGLEAILIVGALMTFLSKMGAAHRKRDINIGVGAAVGASLLTAVALETVFVLSPAHREALEGATMVVATAVLFYVSYWLLSKMEVVKWNQFVKGKVQDALTSGSALALASAAFLAVYREGFETVLFYKALFLSAAGAGALPVTAGILAGSVVLVSVYIGIHRYGVRLPLKPFFAITSAFLYYMAFVFAGKGIAELQEGGLVGTTIVTWGPRIPALGIYPTVETLSAQALLLALAAVALAWNFVLQPRRVRGLTPVMVPEARPVPPTGNGAASAAAAAHGASVRVTPPPAAGVDLLRSLERMEADLAELRAEVERMRRALTSPHAGSRKPPR